MERVGNGGRYGLLYGYRERLRDSRVICWSFHLLNERFIAWFMTRTLTAAQRCHEIPFNGLCYTMVKRNELRYGEVRGFSSRSGDLAELYFCRFIASSSEYGRVKKVSSSQDHWLKLINNVQQNTEYVFGNSCRKACQSQHHSPNKQNHIVAVNFQILILKWNFNHQITN